MKKAVRLRVPTVRPPKAATGLRLTFDVWTGTRRGRGGVEVGHSIRSYIVRCILFRHKAVASVHTVLCHEAGGLETRTHIIRIRTCTQNSEQGAQTGV